MSCDNISLFLHFPVSSVGQQEAGCWAGLAGCRHTGTIVKLSARCWLQARGGGGPPPPLTGPWWPTAEMGRSWIKTLGRDQHTALGPAVLALIISTPLDVTRSSSKAGNECPRSPLLLTLVTQFYVYIV